MASHNFWFLEDLARFKSEREGLDDLVKRADWLTHIRIHSDGYLLMADVDIDIGHCVFEAVLRYPSTFPHSPPSISPRDGNSRWSMHQFDNGDLCLEYRPDNWLPEITGWQMVESAYRLLLGENPRANEREHVESAHRVTEGQLLRFKCSRMPLTRSLVERFKTIEPGRGGDGRSIYLRSEENVVHHIISLELDDDHAWSDPEVPFILTTETTSQKVYVHRLAPGEVFPSAKSHEVFSAAMQELGLITLESTVVLLKDEEVRAYSVFDDMVFSIEPILPPEEAVRLSSEHSQLKDKCVAILGCGSVGSKIATMLSRAGIQRFVLIDDDILASDNLVRHELDWRDVGLHKAKALANRLRRIQPSATVRVHRSQLAGQDSPASAENILSLIAESNLIVDATANPVVGNIMSGFTASTGIPLVWAEVFAGGVGGIIARHRPDIEPSIALMRRAIESWFAQRVTSAQPQASQYELVVEGVPLIADDADVTSIAASAARLAIDTLLQRATSHFPYSVYVVGLAPCDLFSSSFETHPIYLPPPPSKEAPPALTAQEVKDQQEFVASLIQNAKRSE